MLFEKKYITAEYIIKLIIGLLRYNPVDKDTSSEIIYIKKLFEYFKIKNYKFNLLLKLYDTDDILYLRLFIFLLNIKSNEQLLNNRDVRQKVVDFFEKKLDKESFNKIYKIVTYCIQNIDGDFDNSNINSEYQKLLKFVVLNQTTQNLYNLYDKFYEDDSVANSYDLVVSKIFEDYDITVDDNDILLEDSESLADAFEEIALADEEIRESHLFSKINFIQKARIGIFLGESGFGKSMLLCHLTCENLIKRKEGNKKYIVPYFSFENSKEETLCRIMANLTEEDIDSVRFNMRDTDLRKKYIKYYNDVVDKNTILHIIKLPPRRYNMLALEVYLNRVLMKYPNSEIYTIYLDYLDKMIPNNFKSLNRPTHEKLDEISDEFKALVEKYNCAGVTVSQVGRNVLKGDGDWNAGSIRGSIAKFENADIVVSMKYDDTLDELGYINVDFVVDKHRYASKKVKIIKSIYKPYYAKFYLPEDVSKNNYIDNDDDSDFEFQDETNFDYLEDINLKTSII